MVKHVDFAWAVLQIRIHFWKRGSVDPGVAKQITEKKIFFYTLIKLYVNIF